MEEKNEEILRETNFDFNSARQDKKPRKARYTGASLESLRNNISKRRISAKINKYNKEYNKLKELAEAVNNDRRDAETDDEKYVDIVDNIEKFNAQAEKLAKIGVKVLAFSDEYNMKAKFREGNHARPIKVPSFLIGPFKLLSAAGREQARLKKEAKIEQQQKNEDRLDAIVSIAQDAVGQNIEDTVDGNKLDSLKMESVADIEKFVKTIDDEMNNQNKSDDNIPLENEEENIEENVEEKRAQVNEAMRSIYKSKTNSSNKESIDDSIKDMYEDLMQVADVYSLGRVNDELKLIVENKNHEKRVVTEDNLSKILDIEIDQEKYQDFIDIVKFAKTWAKYGNDKQEAFGYIVSSVKNGMSDEEIIAGLDDVELAQNISDKMDVIRKGIENYEKFDEYQKEPKTDEADLKKEQVNTAMKDIANSKYDLNNEIEQEFAEAENEIPQDDETEKKNEEPLEEPNLDNEQFASSVEPESVEEENEHVEFEDSRVTRIGDLTNEINSLMKNKRELEETLGNDAPTESIDQMIEAKRQEIDRIAREGTVNLGMNDVKNIDNQDKDDAFEQNDENQVDSEQKMGDEDWWSFIIDKTLDDPLYQQSSDKVKSSILDQANREFDREQQIKRSDEIKEQVKEHNKEVNEDLLQREEERKARKILKEGWGLTDEQLDSMEKDEDEIKPVDLLNQLQESDPDTYNRMYEAYQNSLNNSDSESKKM